MATRDFHVGVLHFNEPFALELIERLNMIPPFYDYKGNPVRICAEHILIHEVPIDYRTKYDFILDRGSHMVNQAIGIFMTCAFRGVYLINNPLSFHYFIANKDVGFSLVRDLGIKVPNTYILPPHTTPHLDSDDFIFHRHFDWKGMTESIGWPCYLKPAEGRGALGVHKVRDMEELWQCYNASGEKVMTLQSNIESPHPWHVRCLCVGRKIVPAKFIFRNYDQSEYIFEPDFLSPEQYKKIVNIARVINRVFGYEMNSVEFILDYNGEPWAIDFNNPIPDARRQVLGEFFYHEYMNAIIERAQEIAYKPVNSYFLPDINQFSAIAQLPISTQEKFSMALEIANQFYEPQ